MRYGCYKPRAPSLLAGCVVAGPMARPLVAPSRLADASFALHMTAVGRAVAIPAVAAGADDHLPAAPRAVEHPVALLDGRTPATEDWTPGPPSTTLCLMFVVSLWRWHRSPGRRITAWASSSRCGPCFTVRIGGWSRQHRSRRRRSRRRWGSGGVVAPACVPRPRDPGQEPHPRLRLGVTRSKACAFREPDPRVCAQKTGRTSVPEAFASKRTRSTPLRARGRRESDPEENQIHQACAGG